MVSFYLGWICRTLYTVLKTAQLKNNAQPLSPRQIAQLLMNLRYRFALMGALDQKENPLTFLLSGEIETDDRNIQAIAATLKRSRVTDLQ